MGVLITSIFYLGLGVTYVMLYIYLVYWGYVAGPVYAKNWKKLNLHRMREIAMHVIIIGAGEGLVIGIYYLFSYPVANLPAVK